MKETARYGKLNAIETKNAPTNAFPGGGLPQNGESHPESPICSAVRPSRHDLPFFHAYWEFEIPFLQVPR